MAEPDRSVDRATVVGSAVFGFLLEWLAITIGVFSTIDSENGAGGIVAFVALPVLCALPLLHPRTRHAGAGLIIGLAIGSMTGAGVCAGFFAYSASLG
jgi:sorbitol-specific phosphotransferase system component IIBC